ncbi:hypothetical protein [Giesbergeria sinuosa]
MSVTVPTLVSRHSDAVPARFGWLRRPVVWVLLWAVWSLLWLGYYAQHEVLNRWICQAAP